MIKAKQNKEAIKKGGKDHSPDRSPSPKKQKVVINEKAEVVKEEEPQHKTQYKRIHLLIHSSKSLISYLNLNL